MRSLPPVSDAGSRILILGSMPGSESLKLKRYYAHPQNHFWRILSEVFESPCPDDPRKRPKWLRSHRTALWDVIRTCRRAGSLDQHIREAEPNPIDRLIRRRKAIRTIFLNGRTAEKYYRKFFGRHIQIPAYYLPSTSPLHTVPFQKKLAIWKGVQPYTQNRNEWC